MYKTDAYAHTRPNAGVTIAPFIYKDEKIKVLLYKRSETSEVYQNLYSLPNRFFDITEFEDLQSAAHFALKEKTNVDIPHMTQFHTFSGQYIDPTRIITINTCYYSILREEEVAVGEEKGEFETKWVDIEEAMTYELAFNHNEVLVMAYQKVKAAAEYTTAPIHFLPKEFTIRELRILTSLLIDQPLDDSRFRQRIEKTGILIKCEGKMKKGANRPAQLFIYNDDYEGFFYPRSVTAPK